MREADAVVVGARCAGSTLALALAKHGWDVVLIVVAPESLMRGFYRDPNGPGWALIGDACHFKHPGTAQGIADAVEQAVYVAEALCGPKPSLDGYEQWRDERAGEHYQWSFTWGRFPREQTEQIFSGWASEGDAAQDLRDSFSRRLEPSTVMSEERLARWFAQTPSGRGAGAPGRPASASA